MTELRYGQCARCGGSLTANHRCGPQPPMSAESRKALEQIVKDAMTTDKQAAMTTDTLGPCPPTDERRYSTRGRWTVSSDYADYWRRRAERAEGLLREARDYSTRPPASPTCDCDTCKAKRSFPRRVAAALGEAT